MAAKVIYLQAVDTNSAIVSGAKLNVYEAGTTTRRAIYQTAALATEITNPVTAASDGACIAWVDDSAGDVKIIVTNADASSTLFSQDNIDLSTSGNFPIFPLGGSGSAQFATLTLGSSVDFGGVTADPNADRLMFWDDSASQVAWLTPGTGFTIAGGTINLDFLELQDLADPDADRIMFWDDGASGLEWLTVSTGLSLTGTSLTTDDSAIVHDSLSGFVADEHIAHSGVTLTAGAGLTGGGTIAASRSFAVGAGTGIAVNADDVALSHLGLEALVDPNDDRLAFWDDSAGAFEWLDVGAGLTLAGTSLAADVQSVAGETGAISASDLRAAINVEGGADVTDAANVAAAGAVMDGDFSANGLAVRTGAGAYTSRSIASSGNGISITNGDGVSGNPTVTVEGNLSGFVGAFTLPTTDGTINQVLVTDGAGTISFASVAATGTIASQDANNVSITGGSITGITDIAVADGGTGASTAAGAATNLGLGTGDAVSHSSLELSDGTPLDFTNGSPNVNYSGSSVLALRATGHTLTAGTGDGTDDRKWVVSGGGAAGRFRGATLTVYGNEHATNPGEFLLEAGFNQEGFLGSWGTGRVGVKHDDTEIVSFADTFALTASATNVDQTTRGKFLIDHIHTPELYGAAGDGSTNDAADMQTAVRTALGEGVALPANTYVVDSVVASATGAGPLVIYGQSAESVIQRGPQVGAGLYYTFDPDGGDLTLRNMKVAVEQDTVNGDAAQYFLFQPDGSHKYTLDGLTYDGGVTWDVSDNRESYAGVVNAGQDWSGLTARNSDFDKLIYFFLKANTDTTTQTDINVINSTFDDFGVVPMLFNSPALGGEIRRVKVIGNSLGRTTNSVASFQHRGSMAGYVEDFVVGFNLTHGEGGDWFRMEPPAGNGLFIGNIHAANGEGSFEINAGYPSGTGTAADGVAVWTENLIYSGNLQYSADGTEQTGAAWRARNTGQYIDQIKSSYVGANVWRDFAIGLDITRQSESTAITHNIITECSDGVQTFFPSTSHKDNWLIDCGEVILRRSGVMGALNLRTLRSDGIPQAVVMRTADPATAYPSGDNPAPANLDGYAGIDGFTWETAEISLPDGTSQFSMLTGKDMRIAGRIWVGLGRVESNENWEIYDIDFDGTTLLLQRVTAGSSLLSSGSTILSGSPIILSSADGSGRRSLQIQTSNTTGSAQANTRLQCKFEGLLMVKD